MSERAWFHVHPAFGCRPLENGETRAVLVGEDRLPAAWVTLDDDEQTAQEVAFFTRCIHLAVGSSGDAWIRGDVLAIDCLSLGLDDPLDVRLGLLFAVAAPTDVQILKGGQPVVRIGCDLGQVAALLTQADTDQLAPWTPSSPSLCSGAGLGGHDPDVVERHRRRHHKRHPESPVCPARGDAVVAPSPLANLSDPYDPIRVGDQGLVTSMHRAVRLLLPLRIFDSDELFVEFGSGRMVQCDPSDVVKPALASGNEPLPTRPGRHQSPGPAVGRGLVLTEEVGWAVLMIRGEVPVRRLRAWSSACARPRW